MSSEKNMKMLVGETPTWRLTLKRDGDFFDPTGATDFETRVLSNDGETELVIPFADHSIVSGPGGEIDVDTSNIDTSTIKLGKQPVLTKVVLAGKTYKFLGLNILEVRSCDLKDNL